MITWNDFEKIDMRVGTIIDVAPFAKAKKAILDGDVGQVHVIKITSRDPEAPPLSYVKSSGGIFADMTIHDFDMARFLAGSEPVHVFAIGDALIN